MTREEAIKKIKKVVEESVIFEDELEAFDMAIKALEQEPCEDCISRQAVLNSINANCIYENEYNLTAKHIKDAVEQLPSVTPQTRTGKWIDDKCSVCGKGIENLIDSPEWYRNEEPNFCPFCGIKIERAEE